MNSYLHSGASYLMNDEGSLKKWGKFSRCNNNILSVTIFVDSTARYCLTILAPERRGGGGGDIFVENS